MASGNFIKAGSLRPGDKTSYDHHQSREPEIACNDYGKIIEKEYASYSAIFVDYASDFIHHHM